MYVLLSLFLLTASDISAQYSVKIGSFVSPKYGINVTFKPTYYYYDSLRTGNYLSESLETESTFDVDFGAAFKFTFENPNQSLIVDCGYSTSSTVIKFPHDRSPNGTYVSRVHYISLAPMYKKDFMLIGCNVGFPLSATTRNLSGSVDIAARSTEEISTTVEFRAGIIFPMSTTPLSEIDLVILGNFMINGIYGDLNNLDHGYKLLDYDFVDNPKVWTLSIGIRYLFTCLEM